jgi:hypothetical protein
MSSTSALLKKYLQSKALKSSPDETFSEYLGKSSTREDHEAFLEYLDTEYLANACHRLTDKCAVKYGVFSLLDGMLTTGNGRPPSLDKILDEQAYQGGNTATCDLYLGEKRCKGHEQEFRQKLSFIYSKFDSPVDENRAQAVAEYMMGAFKEESEEEYVSNDDEKEDDDEEDVSTDGDLPSDVDMEEDSSTDDEEDDEEDEEEDEEDEEEEDNTATDEEEEEEKLRHHKSSKSSKSSKRQKYMSDSEEEEDGREKKHEHDKKHTYNKHYTKKSTPLPSSSKYYKSGSYRSNR